MRRASGPLIDVTRHKVLVANHPSPLSALRPPLPFLGCGHFSQARLARRGTRKADVAAVALAQQPGHQGKAGL
jgi:uracil DNA glycosylase